MAQLVAKADRKILQTVDPRPARQVAWLYLCMSKGALVKCQCKEEFSGWFSRSASGGQRWRSLVECSAGFASSHGRTFVGHGENGVGQK